MLQILCSWGSVVVLRAIDAMFLGICCSCSCCSSYILVFCGNSLCCRSCALVAGSVLIVYGADAMFLVAVVVVCAVDSGFAGSVVGILPQDLHSWSLWWSFVSYVRGVSGSSSFGRPYIPVAVLHAAEPMFVGSVLVFHASYPMFLGML